MAKEGTETLVVTRMVEDRAGGWSPAGVRGTLHRCIVYPRTSGAVGFRTESYDQGVRIEEGLMVFAPWPVECRPDPTDRVSYLGLDYQVDGAVGTWQKKNGVKLGIMFALTRYDQRGTD